MGVTLHYKGKLRSLEIIDDLIQEVIDISVAKKWKYQIIENSEGHEFDSDFFYLRGIVTGPENCDPICMTFLPDGRLVSPMLCVFPKEEIERLLTLDDYYAFTKTQFAGAEQHIEIVKLLQYISSKYLEAWDCKDDSDYYDTGNSEKLEETMNMIDNAMTALDDAFHEHGDTLDKDNPEEMMEFISNVLGVDDIEVKIVNATIDENGIEIIDEDQTLEDLLNDAISEDISNVTIDELENGPDEDDEEDDIDLSDLLDLDV